MATSTKKRVVPALLAETIWNLPNGLTLLRLALGAAVCVLIDTGLYLAAGIVFAIAALTDAFDGFLARRWNQATVLGRQLDPLVDKVVVAAVYIYLLPIEGTGLAPWMVVAVVARELLIQWVRSLIEGGGEAFGAKAAGKLKTLFQCLSIVGILLFLAMRPEDAIWAWARDIVTWCAIGLTIYSGLSYAWIAAPMLGRRAAA